VGAVCVEECEYEYDAYYTWGYAGDACDGDGSVRRQHVLIGPLRTVKNLNAKSTTT